MEAIEINALNETIHNLYGDRAALMTPAMCLLWLEIIGHHDYELVRAGLRRWVIHHSDRPPSLDQLQEQIDYVEQDQREGMRKRSGTRGYGEILQDAAEAQAANPLRSPDDASYGHLMATLAIRSIDRWQDEQAIWHDKLTLEQRGQQCYTWADEVQTQRPQLAEDLRYAARKFAEALYAPPP